MEINLNSKYVTYINEKGKEYWTEWKLWENCSEIEKLKVNLRQMMPNEIVLDFEDKTNLSMVTKLLIDSNIKFKCYDSGSRGFHIHMIFSNLADLPKEVRLEVRKIIITNFKADLTKSSEDTLIAIEDRPHFKTMNVKTLIYNEDGVNMISEIIITEAKRRVERYRTLRVEMDTDFKEYFHKDPFYIYVKNNIIPDNTGRDLYIFPNLAIACAKSGKTEKEIRDIMEPIIKTNFPGKKYAEFNGWLKKAMNNIITDYNQIQINNWMKQYSNHKEAIYKDVEVIALSEDNIDSKIKEMKNDIKISKFITDKELSEEEVEEMKWTVENWIAEGDICFIAGKAASFKSTISAHSAYACAQGKTVFNKYHCMQCNVLYINEENNRKIFKNMMARIKKGLDIENISCTNVHFSIMENFRLENLEDISLIIDYVIKNNIKLIVFDSFRRFFIGKENDADVINKIFNTLKIIRKKCGDVTMIVIHHAKKDNQNGNDDLRDILRGSSDIVNLADSVIGIHRKIKQNRLIMEHIKSRAGIEMQGRLLKVDSGENNDSTYIWEDENSDIHVEKKSGPEECAERLMTFLTDKKITNFKRADVQEIEKLFSKDTFTKAIRILKIDGILIENGGGKYINYTFNLPEKEVDIEVKDDQKVLDF